MPLCSISFLQIKSPLYIFLISDLSIAVRIFKKITKIIPINICILNPPNICKIQVLYLMFQRGAWYRHCRGCSSYKYNLQLHIYIYPSFRRNKMYISTDLQLNLWPTPYQTASMFWIELRFLNLKFAPITLVFRRK